MGKFGQKVKEARMRCGITARELAKTCRVTPAFITHVEKDGYLPGEKVAVKISRVLKSPLILEAFIQEKFPRVQPLRQEMDKQIIEQIKTDGVVEKGGEK